MIKVVAKSIVLPGKFDEYKKVVSELIDKTRLEPGCIDYCLYGRPEENIAVIMETWETQDHLNVHLGVLMNSGYVEKMAALQDNSQPFPLEIYEQIY